MNEMEIEEDTVKNVNSQSASDVRRKVYLPGQCLDEDERLVYDPSAYVMLHNASTGLYKKTVFLLLSYAF